YVFAGKCDQLWNVMPASIQTPRNCKLSLSARNAHRDGLDRTNWTTERSGVALQHARTLGAVNLPYFTEIADIGHERRLAGRHVARLCSLNRMSGREAV